MQPKSVRTGFSNPVNHEELVTVQSISALAAMKVLNRYEIAAARMASDLSVIHFPKNNVQLYYNINFYFDK